MHVSSAGYHHFYDDQGRLILFFKVHSTAPTLIMVHNHGFKNTEADLDILIGCARREGAYIVQNGVEKIYVTISYGPTGEYTREEIGALLEQCFSDKPVACPQELMDEIIYRATQLA